MLEINVNCYSRLFTDYKLFIYFWSELKHFCRSDFDASNARAQRVSALDKHQN